MAKELLPVATALAIVREHARPLPRRVQLPDALGLPLAEDVVADADSPPFDKALMDGYAVRAADGPGERSVIEEVPAGVVPTRTVGPGEATRIMTGAMLPAGADAVVPFEKTEGDGPRVRLLHPPRPGDNLLPRGREMRAGDVLLRAGHRLRPQDLGLLATVGVGGPLVARRPEVHVVSTGDEIVEWDATPGPGQIRNSNGPMLVAQVRRAGGIARYAGIVPDQRANLLANLGAGLLGDVLVLSGGVSAGKRDLVPEVLHFLGVRALFHKVALKPGKPLFFGVKPRDPALASLGFGPATLVFGLPGNPVSSFVCFELFVRPALAALAGRGEGPRVRTMPLAEGVTHRSDRPTYHPAALDGEAVRLVPWFGSADLRGLGAADALAVLPAGDHRLEAGSPVEVLPLEEDADA